MRGLRCAAVGLEVSLEWANIRLRPQPDSGRWPRSTRSGPISRRSGDRGLASIPRWRYIAIFWHSVISSFVVGVTI